MALGLHALQHRGQEAGGIVAHDPESGFNSAHRFGYVRDNFTKPELMATLPGPLAIGHVRYSTAGTKAAIASCDRYGVPVDASRAPIRRNHRPSPRGTTSRQRVAMAQQQVALERLHERRDEPRVLGGDRGGDDRGDGGEAEAEPDRGALDEHHVGDPLDQPLVGHRLRPRDVP